MLRLIIYLAFLVLISFSNLLGQQNYTTASRKAIGFYEGAIKYYNQRDYKNAIDNLEQAIKADPGFVEAYIGLADVYSEMNDYNKAIEYLNQSIKLRPDFFPASYYNLGNDYFSIGKYQESEDNFKLYLASKSKEPRMRSIAAKRILSCDFAIHEMQHPVPFNPVNLGDSVNSQNDEYWPSLSADEQTLVITVLLPAKLSNAPYDSRQEDFYVSFWKNNAWTKAKDIGPPLNTPYNEGAQSLSVDGKIMYFTACDRPDGIGQCDIYMSVRKGDQWSQSINLGPPVDSKYSEKQPSISPDGKTLYFISNRPGGKGGFDIYSSHLSDDGNWEDPVNLGDSINSPGNEQSPFIHPDNQTLYFSSEGWIGMGGYDLFISHRRADGSWGSPENLGYPINTWKDEIGLIVNARGDKAYFSSNRNNGGGLDIYSFDLYPAARPIPVSYMKGIVIDSETGKKLSARFELIDLATGKLINQAVSSGVNGTFLVTIPSEKDYALNVSREGYLFYSDNFSLKGSHDAMHPYLKDIPLKPIKIGEAIVLKNIFFETNSYQLKGESLIELGKLLDFLTKNRGVSIEISGHTDNIGTEQYNQKLSENRANAVKEYIIQRGISADRIVSKGYGKTRPVAPNETDEGRAQNRRTEFKITGKQ